MQSKVTDMGLHGIDVKDASQCGIEYKLWLSRKRFESETRDKPKETKVDPEYARKMKEHVDKEINKAVGKRMLK